MSWGLARKSANIAAVFLCIFLVIYFTNGRVWSTDGWNDTALIGDSGIFYGSAMRLAKGESPYGITERALEPGQEFPGALYCYLPTLATLLAPLAAFSVKIKTIIWYVIITGSFICSCYYIYKIAFHIGVAPPKGWGFPVTVGIVALLFEPIQNNFIHAQSNTLLLLSIVGFMYYYLKDNFITAGAILGFGITLKFFPLIFIPFLLFRKEWKVMIASGVSVVIFLLLPLYYIDGVTLYTDFYTVLTARSTSDYAFLEFFTTLYRSVIWAFPSLTGAPVKLASICLVMGVLLGADYVARNGCGDDESKTLKVKGFMLAVFSTSILLIHPHSEVHIMVFAYPAIILTGMYALRTMKVRMVLCWGILYAMFFPLLMIESTPLTFLSLVLFNLFCLYVVFTKNILVDRDSLSGLDGWTV